MSTQESRMSKGRRPKVLPSAAQINTSKFHKRNNFVCANPLERLCQQLLPWQILDSLSELQSQKNILEDHDEVQSSLPIVFESYLHYVVVWEPLLIEEIKASILSNFGSCSAKPTSAYFGVPISTSDVLCDQTNLILLESDFRIPNER